MADAGDDDHDDAAAAADPWPLLSGGRVERYHGENQDLESLNALISEQENPPPMLDLLEQGPIAAEPVVPQVQQYVQELGPEDLLGCLGQGEWDRALEILDVMVRNGQAVAGAVDAQGIDPLDISRAHPELVILLRGHAYWDRKRLDGDARAGAYYRDRIELLYPNGTGSAFVDKLLASVRLKSGEKMFKHKKQTYHSVTDYLKIYFPEFRHKVEEGRTRVGMFGEKTGKSKTVRCLACHKNFKHYTPAKVRQHLLHDAKGKQSKCQASTVYIRQEIRAAEDAAAAALLPAPDGQGDVSDDGSAGSSMNPPPPLPPPDAATADSAAPTTSTAPPPVADNGYDHGAAALPNDNGGDPPATALPDDNGDDPTPAPRPDDE
ncbi:hypothetical protein ACP70R_043958 [Stipagrostis hirtigluma subsp. patula]